ncbi:hypothetical protein BAUCODRAFT_336444 [Baudoinia panamericana UAMH 10762]|uniref:Uncharacterized protein n=1 Tax=Baudoinia panamericana (strain UAMH 10762) TaxID=717646 RepID=M2NJ50_BAUPA|nr:uncharacterized protein BAUCODRAFT_336444 [Baudoinia panamericana UAMH 10762]EMC99419.1 hypothetical protein BAUCODRAFT_336444 [Baudoinia panamericana UAMH 10762]
MRTGRTADALGCGIMCVSTERVQQTLGVLSLALSEAWRYDSARRCFPDLTVYSCSEHMRNEEKYRRHEGRAHCVSHK